MAMLNNQRVLETDNLPLDDSIEWSRMLVYLSCEHVPFKDYSLLATSLKIEILSNGCINGPYDRFIKHRFPVVVERPNIYPTDFRCFTNLKPSKLGASYFKNGQKLWCGFLVVARSVHLVCPI